MNKIENVVKKYIIHHGMFKWQTPYIVALSGGADSVALLLILKNIGLDIFRRNLEAAIEETIKKDK